MRPRRLRREIPAADAEDELLARLRAGDEQAFVLLVARHHDAMLRLASSFVSSRAVAEEVVQDTWMGALRGLDGFAGRSSLRTWLLRILVNRARSTGVRERRSVAVGDAGPVVDQSRFDASGAWMSPPEHWVEDSDDRLLAQGLSEELQAALERLPAPQREVVMLRDVDGLSGPEVCEVLELSEVNQRVLLHRGRSHLRQVLEAELGGRVKMFWSRSELACQQVVEMITDYLEGALSRSQRRRLEGHLDGCEHCSEYLEQMRATIRLAGRLRAQDLTPAMRDEFTEIYRRWRSEG